MSQIVDNSVNTAVPEQLITTYLHMTARDQFLPSWSDAPNVVIMPMLKTDVPFYKFLYTSVGQAHNWRDRLIMPETELKAILGAPGVTIHVLYVEGVPAGYIELVDNSHDVEIAAFGLRSPFQGVGLGKHLLSWGLEQAWNEGARRIWLHTCNLDGANALTNYQKRGLSIYDVRTEPMPAPYE